MAEPVERDSVDRWQVSSPSLAERLTDRWHDEYLDADTFEWSSTTKVAAFDVVTSGDERSRVKRGCAWFGWHRVPLAKERVELDGVESSAVERTEGTEDIRPNRVEIDSQSFSIVGDTGSIRLVGTAMRIRITPIAQWVGFRRYVFVGPCEFSSIELDSLRRSPTPGEAADSNVKHLATERDSSDKRRVYVRLLDEGTECWRPAWGIAAAAGTYRLLPSDDYDAADEHWEFPPGSTVICELRTISGEQLLVAVRLAGPSS